jgi:hypothetical protein
MNLLSPTLLDSLDIVRSEVRHQPARRALASRQSADRHHDDPARHQGGLFAPVELLVTEKERGPGTTITDVRPLSLIFIEVAPRVTQRPNRSMRSWSNLEDFPPWGMKIKTPGAQFDRRSAVEQGTSNPRAFRVGYS